MKTLAGVLIACVAASLTAQRMPLETSRRAEGRIEIRGESIRIDEALEAVADAMGWRLRIDAGGSGLGAHLASQEIDIAIEDEAVKIAEWIALAGDARAYLGQPRLVDGALVSELVIRALPDADTVEGRGQFLRLAARQFHSWLEDYESLFGPTTATGRPVRAALGTILRRIGDPERGALFLEDVLDSHPEDAMYEEDRLRLLVELGRCYFELGTTAADDWAERKFTLAIRLGNSDRYAAEGALWLGRLLFRQGSYDACVATLRAELADDRWLRHRDVLADIHLLIGHASVKQGNMLRASRAEQRALALMDGFRDDPDRQVEWSALRGVLASDSEDHGIAVVELARFLELAPSDDPRREELSIRYAESALGVGLVVDAWQTAARSFESVALLGEPWATRCAMAFYESSRLVGDEKDALEQLEIEARRRPLQRTELLLFVASKLRGGRARLLLEQAADRRDVLGDRAREALIGVTLGQIVAAGDAELPISVAEMIARIGDSDSKRKALDHCARFYAANQRLESAAAAWQGVIK